MIRIHAHKPLHLVLLGVASCVAVVAVLSAEPVRITNATLHLVTDNERLDEDRTLWYAGLLNEAATDVERRRIIGSAVNEAESIRARGDTGYGVLRRFAASAYLAENDVPEALAILDRVRSDPETDQDLVSASRMAGQILAAEGNYLGALRVFDSALDVVRFSPETTIMVSPAGVESVASQTAALNRMLGRNESALDALAVLTGQYRSVFNEASVRAAIGTTARIHEEEGRMDEALLCLEDVFATWPNYGLESEYGIGTRLRYLGLKYQTDNAPDLLRGLEEMWRSPHVQRSYASIAVGQALLQWHDSVGNTDDAVLARWELANRAENLSTRGPSKYRESSRGVFLETLWDIATLDLVDESTDDAVLAIEILDSELPSDHRSRDFLVALQDRVQSRR